MDIGIVRGLLTVVLLILFLCIVVWSFSRRRRDDFDKAARMPLEDDSHAPKSDVRKNKERE